MGEGTRINKFLSEAGVCSRRVADRQVALGNVTIDGETAGMGSMVLKGQKVCFGGREVKKEQETILLAVHKPAGIVCTAEKREKDNIVDFIRYPKRIYPVGRLDKDSSGLILMTNCGDIVNKIMRAGNMHEKEYVVTVNLPLTQEFIRGMGGGVPLKELGVMTRKCKVKPLGKREFQIILTQGYNRQIRRMCEYFGYRVEKLVRTRIMNITLGDLPEGTYRKVTDGEWKELREMIRNSSGTTVIPKGNERGEKGNGSGGKNKNRRIKKEDRVPQ